MSWTYVALELAEALLPVVGALIALFIAFGIRLLRKRIAEIDNDMARKSLSDALDEAGAVAADAVRATNQILVGALKAKNEDGKLTKEEALEAMRTAKAYFISHVTTRSRKVLGAALGPINQWLDGLLEARLATEKAQAARR